MIVGWLDEAQEAGARLAPACRELRAHHVMTPEPRTLSPNEPLSNAVEAFLDDRFGALPVVDEEERLVGVLSYVDVLAATAATDSDDLRAR